MDSYIAMFQSYLPTLTAAGAILIGGWLLAVIISGVVKGIFGKLSIDNKLAAWLSGSQGNFSVEKQIGDIAFYLVMLFVLVGFFETLGITLITEPLNTLLNEVFMFAPRLFAGVGLLAAAWLIGTILKKVSFKVIAALPFTQKLSEATESDETSQGLASSISETLYWLVFLLFLPSVLNALGLTQALEPINALVSQVVGYLPNLFSAGVLLVVGWFAARIVQKVVTNIIAASGVDAGLEKLGFSQVIPNQKASNVAGIICYAFIFIPIAISALNALGIAAISEPAVQMLTMIIETIPLILGASVILAVAFFIGKFLGQFVSTLLSGIGFDGIFQRLGVAQFMSNSNFSASKLVGHVAQVAVILFGLTEAFNIIGLTSINLYVNEFLELGGSVALGMVILGVGLFVANAIANYIQQNGSANAYFLSMVTRYSILFLSVAMSLRQMGIANEIIELTFGLLVGSVAVAVAIAFGLGGRDVAARELGEWVNKFKVQERLPASPEETREPVGV